jgi:oligogalacturonide lyase
MRYRIAFASAIVLTVAACGGGGGDGESPPSALSYTSPVQTTVGTAITPLSPTVTGTVSSYSVSPALPAGLSLDTTTGMISGTPRAAAAQSSYTITAANAGGSTTFGLVITSLACDTGPPLALLPPEPSAAPGDDFVDPVTGHRIVRLSRLENGGASFYFTQNEFNCRGNKLVFANAHAPLGRWLYSIDLETFDIQPLASSEAPIMEVVARKRNEVLYLGSDGTLRATNLDTHATRSIAQLPASVAGFTINLDETLIAGIYNDGLADYKSQYPTTWFQQYFDAHRVSYLFTVDADSGALKRIHQENNWLDHVQFSPSDPHLLMFDHQGPPDSVTDPMWLIDATGTTAPRSLYTKTVTGEYVSHEFWSPDGRWVYFDHQVPWGGSYFIGGIEVATGTMGGYPIAQADWGLHYNISHDGSLFASDGDDSSRKTLLLYRIVNRSLQVEPLADLSASDYGFQPNVHFTADDKWVAYMTSQGFHEEIYAVSVAK